MRPERKDRRRCYFISGYIFLIVINIIILLLGLLLVYRLMRYF